MLFSSIHHTAIISSDKDKAIDFYSNKLGFPILREVYREDRKDWIITLQGPGETEIELFVEENPPLRITNPEARGLRHIAFYTEDIMKKVDELKKIGIETEEVRIDPYDGKRMTFFRDPDGLPIEIHE
ncbi:MAG: VOC family protein [Candidatus Ornithospirochaeta sp.]